MIKLTFHPFQTFVALFLPNKQQSKTFLEQTAKHHQHTNFKT